MISHEGYANLYQETIWDIVTSLDNVTYEASAAGLGYYVVSEKDAGEYTYDLALTSEHMPTGDGNYSASLYVRPGRLQILPVELPVTTGSDTKAYDGTALTNSEASLSGLVETDKNSVTVTATGSQTEVGSSDNTYTISWGEVNPGNYTIKENLGTLEVTTAELIVTVNDKTAAYNGSEQYGYAKTEDSEITVITVTGTGETINTEDYEVKGLGKDDTLTISYTPAKGTNVGTTSGSFAESYTIVNAAGNDVSSNYIYIKEPERNKYKQRSTFNFI